MKTKHQIIYINGPSSSGKTTLAQFLQQELDSPFLHIGIDRVIGMMPDKLNDWEGGPAPLGFSWKNSTDETGHPVHEIQLGPFAALNADARVMEYFPSVLSRQESDQMMKRMQAKIEERGWGWWAVSLVADEKFIGFIGMNDVDQATFPAHFTPAVEIGWRLANSFWRKGYASEGARVCLKYGFETLNLKEIVAFTAIQNM
jgi:RimJ/RimL family protein N-acetyltransferase